MEPEPEEGADIKEIGEQSKQPQKKQEQQLQQQEEQQTNKRKIKTFDYLTTNIQRKIENEVELGATVLSFDSIGRSSAINRTASNYGDSREKVKKMKQLISLRTCNTDIAREYITHQGMIEDISYKNVEQVNFQIMLTDNYYLNSNSKQLCFPMKIKKAATSQAT